MWLVGVFQESLEAEPTGTWVALLVLEYLGRGTWVRATLSRVLEHVLLHLLLPQPQPQ